MFNPNILRRIAQLVLITFTSLTLQPLQAAVLADKKATPRPNVAPSQSERYSQQLQGLTQLLQKTQAKRDNNVDAELKQIRSKRDEINKLEAQALADFDGIEKHLKQHNLPREILARHQTALAEFKTKQGQLKQKLAALDTGGQAALTDLADFMQQQQKRKSHSATDPKKLPFGTPKHKVRKPIESERDFRASLFKSKPIHLAGPIPNGLTLPVTTLPDTPSADDLAETEDVVLTPAIKALAQSLNNNPVQIYNWVRNNIEFIPSYGSIQGADMTLQTKKGNSFDTASLLIGLLRAANIPARYVYGTIQVPADKAMNWLGGVDNAAAALQLLEQGGIPSAAVSNGGQTTHIKLEHVWVEAYVDYVPSRGAINKVGDSWTPLDASYKLSSDKAAMPLQSTLTFNAQGVIDSSKQGAVCSKDSAQGLNLSAIQTAYSSYQNQFNQYLNQQAGSDVTVGDVLGARTINSKNYTTLLGSLPYTTLAQAGQFTSLPDILRWRFNYGLYTDETARSQQRGLVNLSSSLPKLAGKALSLSFAPATQADADTLASYLNNNTLPADLPAYLIHVKAELRLDGQVIATGGDISLASPLLANSSLYDPSAANWDSQDYDVDAGEYQAWALDGQGIAAGQIDRLNQQIDTLKTSIASGQSNNLSREQLSGLILQQSAIGYFALSDANNQIYQRAARMLDYRMPSYARAVAQVEPQYALGIITKATFPGVSLHIDRYSHAAVSKQNDNLAAYNRQHLERASAYSHVVLEQLWQGNQGVSASKALTLAASQNQTLYRINSSNLNTVLPLISLDSDSETRIQNAANAGKQTLTHSLPLSLENWQGAGLITEEDSNGNGDYQLSNQLNSALYPSNQRMVWLALGNATHAVTPVAGLLDSARASNNTLSSLLAGMSTTRWQFFPAQNEVANGLFLNQLNLGQVNDACDALVSILAAAQSTQALSASNSSNHPPVILSSPLTNAAAGQAYRYALQAVDSDGDRLSYKLINAPSGVTVDSNGIISWSSPSEGAYTISVRVDDGKAYTEQSYILAIGQGSLQLDLTLSVSPKVVNAGENITVTLATTGGQGTITRSLSVDGQNITLNSNGQATFLAAASGSHKLVALASDSQNQVQKEDLYSVRNPADTTPPVVLITSPVQDAELASPTDIIGTASDDNLASYQLLLRPIGSSDQAWVEIGRGYQAVQNAKLGQLNPTTLANGLYELALLATDVNGVQTSTILPIELYRDLKIGQFSLSFLDLEVNAVGIPIRVTRTYDTRNKAQKLDFGYGWSVDYQNVQLKKNMAVGVQWETVRQQLQLCLRPIGKRKIAITLPNGKSERFTADNAQECGFAQVPEVNIQFTAQPGTTSTLEAINIPSLMQQGGVIYDTNTGEPWNPKEFKLTTEDNYAYYLTEGIGIIQIVDPYGNILSYGANGIIHSNGQSVSFTRDAQGRITKITDPAGKIIQYAYDANGDLSKVTDRLNQSSQYQYNREHGLTSYTDPQGTVLARYSYDAQGRLLSVTDAQGQAILSDHDTANNCEVVTDRLGRKTIYQYDSNGNITDITDPLGHITRYSYDALGNETRVTDPLGNVTQKTFDPQTAKQLSETDPLGNITRYNYDPVQRSQLNSTTDANGNVTYYNYYAKATAIGEPGRSTIIANDDKGNTASLNIAGQTTHYGYDDKGNKTSETDALGNTTTYTYDSNGRELTRTWQRTQADGTKVSITTRKTYDAEGRVISETDALGGTTYTQWNSAGKPTQITDPQGNVTRYEYDAQARLVKTIYPDNTFDSTSFDAEGNTIASADRAGRITRMDYDGLNRLIKTTYPDGTFDSITYDAAGRTEASHDTRGNPISNQYDAAGRLTASTDALGNKTTYAYDANGNRTSQTDAQGKVTSYTYDALNRLTKTTYPDNTTRTVTYLPGGQKDSETDQNGNQVQYGYDALGRLNKVTLTSNGVTAITSYGYDEVGNKVSQTDANGNVTRWAYDNANRMISRTLPNGEVESYSYNNSQTTHTDFAGKTSRYTADANGRPAFTTDANNNTVQTTYTTSGQVATVTDSRGVTRYTYDSQDRLIKQENPDKSFLAYAYDAASNITERSTASGTVKYAFDKLNRLVSVTDPQNKVTQYQYDANGNRVKTVNANGTEANYSYDSLNRLTNIEHKQTATGVVLRGYAYTLKPNGQRSQIREYDKDGTLRTLDYAYDALNRLTQEKVLDARSASLPKTTDYVYGKTGNRSSKTETQGTSVITTTYTYDANDRLTQEVQTQGGTSQTTTYGWDANGNMTQKVVGGVTTNYVWDSNNRLVEVKRNGASVATYQYDANGNRVGKTTADGTQISYLVDSNMPFAQVVEEKSGTDSASYLYGLERIQQTNNGQAAYYHHDGLGSTRGLSASVGNLTDTYDYEAYGTTTTKSGASKNEFLFAGEQFDAEAGWYYNRARWYEPNTARFTSQDTFSGWRKMPISLNKYVYANADPISMKDPSGMMTLGDTMAGINAGMNLMSVALPVYNSLFGNPDSPTFSEIPSLWDMIFSVMTRGMLASMSGGGGAGTGSVSGGGSGGNSGKVEHHHTIPVYTCGARNQQLVTLDKYDHYQLHRDLYATSLAIDIVGFGIDLLVYKRPAKTRPLQRFAYKKAGREAIVAGLEIFYHMNDYWTLGSGTTDAKRQNIRPRFGTTIENVFPKEAFKFIKGRTSLPLCKQ